MPIDEIQRLISLEALDLPGGVDVERIDVEPYVDSDGEDALRILIVLNDQTDLPLPKGWSPEVKDRIHQTLLRGGCHLFPYTHYALESELQEISDE